MQMFELFVQMMFLNVDQRALLRREGTLLLEKRVGFLAADTAQGQCRGNRINGRSACRLGAGRALVQAFCFFQPVPTMQESSNAFSWMHWGPDRIFGLSTRFCQ